MTVKKGLEGKRNDESEDEEFKITSEVKQVYAQCASYLNMMLNISFKHLNI